MAKFLDKTGLDTLWAKIKSTFQTLGNLVTSWGSTPSDTKYPSEKLVKAGLDGKLPLYKLGSEIPSSQDFVCLRIKANYVSGVNKSQVLLYDITSFADGTINENAGAYVGFKGFLIGGKPQGGGEVICVKICAKVAYGQITGSSGWRTLKSDSSTCGPEIIKRTEDGVDKYYLSIFYDATLFSGNNVLVGQFLWQAPYGIRVYSYQNGVIGEYTPNQTYPANEPLWDRLQTFTSNIHANTSTKLAIARKLKTNLARTADSTFDGSADQTNIPVTGTLPIANGGTGKTSVTAGNYLVGNGTSALQEHTPNAAANNMLSALPDWTANPTDGVKLIRRDTAGGASFGQVTFLTVWNYIKDKISSVLGLTETSYGGNAATATTAAGYTSGGAIDTALQGKVDEETGKGLSSNDFTDTYKSNVDSNTSARHTHSNKTVLDGISSTDVDNWNAAEPNVQSDWDQTTSTADDYIKNKPQNLVQDASYVHTDNNYTTTDKNKVASSVQPGDLATVATSGSYTDLSNRPYSDDFGYFSSGSSSSNLWGQVAKVKWLSSLDGSSTVRGTLLMHQYSSNIVTADFEIMFTTSGSIGYARLFGCFTGSFFTKVKLAVAISSTNKELVFYGYLGGIPYSGISVTVQSVKRYSGNTISDFTVTYSKSSSSVSAEPSGLTYCENVSSTSVRAVTSIDTSNMDPDVLYVM